MPPIQMRQITEDQLKALKLAASKTIEEQLNNTKLSKNPQLSTNPPANWKGSIVGEVVFYNEKPLPLDRYAREVAHELLKNQGIEIPSNMIGVGFRSSQKEKELIDFIQGQGVAVLYHNCGYARSLMPLYPSLGLQAYESLTPPPYGDTVIEEAVGAFGRGTTLLGGIDQLDLLRTGEAREIEAAVKSILDTVRGRCHFILGTTDYFNENTPADKIRVLADAGRKYGKL